MTAVQFGAQIQLLYSDATTHTLRHAWWDGARWTDQWMKASRHESMVDARSPGQRLRDAIAGSFFVLWHEFAVGLAVY